ncbi:MAG: PAS domain S-box protein [Planctomycetes bacterium]|nr:PAS domain S-box protein [Planctomycetota bacterium]
MGYSNSARTISGALANAQLYTEHLATEMALRESEERYRMLVENANDAIVVIQGDRVAYHNVAWERMLGYGSEDIKDQNFYQYVYPADRDRILEYYQRRLLEEEAPDEYEMKVLTADGKELTLEAKPRVVRFKNRRGVMVVMRDITERKRLQEQLAQAQKMEAIGQLAGGVAHDFNNLLSVIMGFSQLAENARTTNADELPGHLAEIRKASERGARLTNQLLAFSRRQIIEPKVVDINQLIVGLDRMLHRLIRENIELVIHETKKDATVFVDPGQIEQVVVNLMVNARDAMPEGGELSISLDEPAAESDISELEDNDPGRYLIITVRDNGIGMSEEVQSRIFEPFFTTKEVGAGTGLGLSIVYQIMADHKGTITVESEVGKGTTFTIIFPVNLDELLERT